MIKITKYEKARILGLRALQLSNGAEPLVSTEGLDTAISIAEREYMEHKIPCIIRRKMPNGSFEDIRVSQMILE